MPLHILNQQPFTPEQTAELVNLLRMNFLYQNPSPHEDDPGQVRLRMIAEHWSRMIELITEHGGWELPEEVAQKLRQLEAENGRNGNGRKPGDDSGKT